MESFIDDSRIHEGHRARMRAKMVAHGNDIFDTYELLEMLLYYVIPYRDTNPVAKNLLYAFGSLDGVLSADTETLTHVNGVGERAADLISLTGMLGDILGAEMLNEGAQVLTDYEAVGKYFVNYFRGVTEKQVAAMYLDSSMRLIDVKTMYNLEYESGGVKAKSFIDEALKNHAAVVITSHNHPYGPFYPTPGDRATNTVINEGLAAAGLIHAEHYIVCGDCFAGIDSLQHFKAKLSQMVALQQFNETREAYGSDRSSAQMPLIHAPAVRNLRDGAYFVKLLSLCVGEQAEAVADALLGKYGTIESALTPSVRELTALVGEKAAVFLKLVAYLTSRRRTDLFAFGKSHSSAEIAEYLKALYIGESVEKIYLISFDARDRVIGCDLLGEGTVNASEVLPRKAIETAMMRSSVSVSVAHNHPFGTPDPSIDDLNMTGTLANIFLNCEIALKEHFIIAGQLCDIVESQ